MKEAVSNKGRQDSGSGSQSQRHGSASYHSFTPSLCLSFSTCFLLLLLLHLKLMGLHFACVSLSFEHSRTARLDQTLSFFLARLSSSFQFNQACGIRPRVLRPRPRQSPSPDEIVLTIVFDPTKMDRERILFFKLEFWL